MQYLLSQQISNDPKFTNLKRFIVVRNVNIQTQYNQIVIDAHIVFKDSDNNDEPVNKLLNEIQGWIINNNDTTTVRNPDGSAVENPDYDPSDPNSNEFVKMPSYDYFYAILINPNATGLINLLRSHIIFNDSEVKFFDSIKLGYNEFV